MLEDEDCENSTKKPTLPSICSHVKKLNMSVKMESLVKICIMAVFTGPMHGAMGSMHAATGPMKLKQKNDMKCNKIYIVCHVI